MRNYELADLINSYSIGYLQRFIGFNTEAATLRFKKAFIKYLSTHTDGFETLLNAIKAFAEYRYELKAARAA